MRRASSRNLSQLADFVTEGLLPKVAAAAGHQNILVSIAAVQLLTNFTFSEAGLKEIMKEDVLTPFFGIVSKYDGRTGHPFVPHALLAVSSLLSNLATFCPDVRFTAELAAQQLLPAAISLASAVTARCTPTSTPTAADQPPEAASPAELVPLLALLLGTIETCLARTCCTSRLVGEQPLRGAADRAGLHTLLDALTELTHSAEFGCLTMSVAFIQLFLAQGASLLPEVQPPLFKTLKESSTLPDCAAFHRALAMLVVSGSLGLCFLSLSTTFCTIRSCSHHFFCFSLRTPLCDDSRRSDPRHGDSTNVSSSLCTLSLTRRRSLLLFSPHLPFLLLPRPSSAPRLLADPKNAAPAFSPSAPC
jgi:hypothetical protein